MDRVFVEEDAVTRSFSHVPPTHYIIKVQLFSSLPSGKSEFGEFEAGRYKWKLVLCLDGYEDKKVEDHISLYLSIADTSSLKFGWDVYVIFRLFLLDQNKDKFLVVQDVAGKERRFHGLKLEWGFDQFISLEDFNDASNGYLVDDTCVFGAEVFVKERNIAKGECLSMIKYPQSIKHLWKIEHFSQLITKYHETKLFTAGNHKWKIELYPKGNSTTNYLSLFLALADSNVKVYVEYTLRILDQVEGTRHATFTLTRWLSTETGAWGWPEFVELSRLNDPRNGLLVNDVCMVEAEVTVRRILKAL